MLGMMSFTPSFTPEFFLDVLQSTKRIMTDRVITDPVLNKAAHDFMNVQLSFGKVLCGNTTTITKYFVDSQTNLWFPKTKK